MDRYSINRYGPHITGKSTRGRGFVKWSSSRTVETLDTVSESSETSSNAVPNTKDNLIQTSQPKNEDSSLHKDGGQSMLPKTIPSDVMKTKHGHEESPSKPYQASCVHKYQIQQIPEESRIWSTIDKIVEKSFKEIQLSSDLLDLKEKRCRRSFALKNQGDRDENSDDESEKNQKDSFRRLLETNDSENDDEILNVQSRTKSLDDEKMHINRSRRWHSIPDSGSKKNILESKLRRRASSIGSTRMNSLSVSKDYLIEKKESHLSSHHIVRSSAQRRLSQSMISSAPANNTLGTKMKRRASSISTKRIFERSVSNDHLNEKQESKISSHHVVHPSSQRRSTLSMSTLDPAAMRTSRRLSCPMVSPFVHSNAHPDTRRTSIKEVKSIEKYQWSRRISGLTAEVDANENEIDNLYEKLTTNPKDSLRKIPAEQSTAIFDIDECIDPVEMVQNALSSFELFESSESQRLD